MNTLDHQGFLDDAMARRYSVDGEPFDKTALHVSDLTNCVRAVWYRRNGIEEFPVTAARRLTMARGRAIELEIREAIVTELGRRWRCYHTTAERGPLAGVMSLVPVGFSLTARIGRAEEIEIGPRDMTGHPDLYCFSGGKVKLYEVKSLPFLGPAPLTKHVMQAAGYELMVLTAEPATVDIETYVIEVSAVTGEFRSHKLDRGVHASEVTARLQERQWNTAPGDELPDPSIPDEMFALRGRAPNKRLVNLLCEKYCGYRECPENHVGEETALSDD